MGTNVKKVKEISPLWYFFPFVLLIVCGITYDILQEIEHPMECKMWSKIVSIPASQGQSVTLKFENGKEMEVYRPYVKIGDNYCLYHERKK